MAEDGHKGPHNFVRDDEIMITFKDEKRHCALVGCLIIGPHEHKFEGPAEAKPATRARLREKITNDPDNEPGSNR